MTAKHDIPVLLERLSRILQNEAHAGGVKPTQWEALRYLARANRFSRSPSAVTAYLGVTKGTVSQTLNALDRKGLIRKRADPGDRRNVTIEVTRAGRDLLARDPVEVVLTAAARLSAAERRALSGALEKLLVEALRRRGGRPFGVCRSCRFFRKRAKGGSPHRCGLLDVPLSDTDSERICVEQEPAGAGQA
ncbi:MAG: MarR family transcriptional regulator [Kiloniellales bacterium]|nr:MarR family transcriptional regulator [Kiloniellales bacterium]